MSDDLLRELQELLEVELSQTGFRKYPATPEVYAPPAVHLHSLPVRRAKAGESADAWADQLPSVVLRAVSGEDGDTDDGARTETVEVWFLCGVFTAGGWNDGARDLASLMGRIRRMLLRRRLYLRRWERQLPINWEVGDGADHGQPHPFHGGSVRVRFSAPATAEIFDIETEVAVYGTLSD